jgi:hypothetical protein
MKRYLLGIHQPDGPVPPPQVLQQVMRDVSTVIKESKAAGAWVFNGGLHSPDSTKLLQLTGDEVRVSDGPITAGREHLSGFVIIKVFDLEEALEWGARLARATMLPIEVRAFQGDG